MELSRLQRIDDLAVELHRGQVDRQGVPYIEHLRAVAAGVGEPAQPVALLHDAIEDRGATTELLRHQGLSPEEIGAIELLTRRASDSYEEFIDRIVVAEGRAGELAREVKRSDLEHNLGRMTAELERERPDLAARYRRALVRLPRSDAGMGGP